ncbi:2Fe-2S iron-sulfur cluster-binding protein [Pseudonocardia pini]|uniref:2Fe-2S iron-sulfur cluster-binding protein n=1 Tax=Pseudonocardia pini TaxID=2758030 RepID=UPI0015EFEFB2|nr:2Fe-2S iron-sulfur cluster-binding protein [Pseudonocardia pini]
MPTVTYVLPDGSNQTITTTPSTSVMQAALAHRVPGIIGECGGAATCGTCHVYLDESTESFLPPGEDEEAMLEWTASPRKDNSRLACQLKPAGDAQLVVRVPEEQQ